MSVSASDATAARWIGNPFGSYNLRRPSYQDQPIYANHNAAVQDITSQHHFISTSVQTNHTDRVYDRSLAHTLHVKSVATSPTTSNTTLHAEQTDSSFQQHSLAHASSKSDSTSKHQPSDPSTFVPSLSRHSIASLYSLINPDSLDQQLYRLPRPHIYGVANASLAEDTCDSSIYTDNTMSDCDEDDVSVLDQWVFPNPAILDESELSQKHKQY
ncbi:expressed protein [Batrachochytrium dendrobatidis JAM81]|uniref:Expressed protein n=2 Tax=Batrachochytrium dendrobatidis TaxID=109871 RepID=F4PB91_BATDJ|nr:uncharacterized protein BATDEDRAFT_37412 [Batrachochytrium dendrobatidis JAM81]EGF77402.1 expressed protein [Batrachochytrium dendrobatidis JAM81]|eukprot:XP_006682008.1 expressed protein [Batrachochytrium dendrobatidis JAM81]